MVTDYEESRQLADRLLGVSVTILAATKCSEKQAVEKAWRLWKLCLQIAKDQMTEETQKEFYDVDTRQSF